MGTIEKLTRAEIEAIIKSEEICKDKIINESIKIEDGAQICDAKNIMTEYLKAYATSALEISRESFIKQEFWNDNMNQFKYELLQDVQNEDVQNEDQDSVLT